MITSLESKVILALCTGGVGRVEGEVSGQVMKKEGVWGDVEGAK